MPKFHLMDPLSDRSSLRVDSRARWGFALLLSLIATAAGAKAILFDTLDPDCFWHLRVADQLVEQGIGPLVDRLSFASIQSPWTPYSWLAELGMREVWKLGRHRAAAITQAIMQAAFVLFIGLACRSARARRMHADQNAEAPSYLAAAVCATVAAMLSMAYLSFRPVTAALMLLALAAWLLIRDRAGGERSRSVWMLIPLTVLIVNLHMSAIFIPAWIGALLAGAMSERLFSDDLKPSEANRRVVRYGLLLVLTAAGCCATPMLRGMIAVTFYYDSTDPIVSTAYMTEMRPFFTGPMGKISAGLVILSLLCIFARIRRFRMGEVLWLAASILWLTKWGRFAPIFAIGVAPMLAVAFPRFSDRPLSRRPSQIALAVLLVLTVSRSIRALPAWDGEIDQWLNRHGPEAPGYPCEAAAYVEGNVTPAHGKLITEFGWGGFVEWRLGLQYQALIDGRTQLFTPELWRSTILANDDERQRFLAGVPADAAILQTGGSAFRRALVRLGWTSVYRDERAEVLVPPRSAQTATAAEPCPCQ